MVQACNRQPSQRRGRQPRHTRVATGEISQITAKQFVRSFATERDRHLFRTHLCEIPHWQTAGIRARLIGEVGELLDRLSRSISDAQIDFGVVGAVVLRDFLNVRAFVEAAAFKRDGKSLQRLRRGLRRVMKDGRRVEAAARPQPNRHVGDEMFFDRLLSSESSSSFADSTVHIFSSQRERAPPIGFDLAIAMLPDENISGRKLLDALHQRVGRRARNSPADSNSVHRGSGRDRYWDGARFLSALS